MKKEDVVELAGLAVDLELMEFGQALKVYLGMVGDTQQSIDVAMAFMDLTLKLRKLRGADPLTASDQARMDQVMNKFRSKGFTVQENIGG